MEMKEMNFQLVRALQGWDPFRLGPEGYDPEIADTIGAVHDLNDPVKLTEKISEIYEFSFEKTIPIDQCRWIADKLLSIKNQGSCSF